MALKPLPVTHRTCAADRYARVAFAYTELFACNWQSTRVINHSLNIFMRPSRPSATNVFSPCFPCSSFELLSDAWCQERGTRVGSVAGGQEVPMVFERAIPVTLQIVCGAT